MKYMLTVLVTVALLVTSAYAEDPWTPSPLCPFPSEELTRFQYEGDCSKYWECYEGARYPMDCPAGLEFNANASRCDDPAIANCDPDATIIYPTFPHSTVSTVPTEDPGPVPQCPYPSDELTFYPVVNNCSQYWECFQGNRYLMNCPSGLFWNVDHDYCDFAENVDCSKNNATTTSGPTTPGDNSSTGSPTETTTSVWTPDPLCPYPSHELTFYPNPDNCTQYYECYEGNKFLMSCPTGLYWNDLANICDYKENVNCNRTTPTPTPTPAGTTATADATGTGTDTSATVTGSSPGSTAPTTEPSSTNTGESSSPTPTGTTVSTSPTTFNPICVGEADGTYLANPHDCSRFYECVSEKATEGQCPGDLVWNQSIHSCDYKSNVDCSNITMIFRW